MANPVIIRTENCLVTYGVEDTWGHMVGTDSRFGLHETATAADPALEWYPFFGVSSGRDRQTILRGKWTLRGGVPNVKLQGGAGLGKLLQLPIGRLDGSTVKEGQSDTDGRVKSITMQIAARDTNGDYRFIRNYFGGKVNRFSLGAQEGEELQATFDEIIFKDVRTNFGKSVKNTGVGVGTDPGLVPQGELFFAGATMEFFDTTLARLKSVSLSIDNQCEAKYYLAKAAGDPEHMTQVCNDIVEGKRKYSLDVELDLVDPDTDFELMDFLLSQGTPGGGDGFTVGGKIKWDFAMAPGTGDGSLIIDCSLNPTNINPGTVVTDGKMDVPAPPGGYFASSYTLDVDSLQIEVPSGAE